MGCHTWFSRPVTKEEFELFKNNAIADAWELHGETKENIEFDCVDLKTYEKVKKSVEEGTDYWWEYGYGVRFEDGRCESVLFIDGKLHLDLSDSINPIFKDLDRYFDVFRVQNYPRKKIHSRKELRRWMGKRYFELQDWQLEKISKFFKENPGGIIHFG